MALVCVSKTTYYEFNIIEFVYLTTLNERFFQGKKSSTFGRHTQE